MDRNRRWLLAWGLGYAAVGGASVLVPLYAIALDASLAFVGLIAATAALVGVPGAVAWAALAARTDRRRPFVLVALGATAGVLALVPLATTPVTVLALNAALWFVVAAAVPVLNLIVVEGAPVDEWDGHIASLNAWQGYGWVAGLLVGTAWTLVVPRFGVDPLAGQRLLFSSSRSSRRPRSCSRECGTRSRRRSRPSASAGCTPGSPTRTGAPAATSARVSTVPRGCSGSFERSGRGASPAVNSEEGGPRSPASLRRCGGTSSR
ncbi:hypothetical protein ACFQFH_09745 [Halobaculum halobium]|uniref:MFS transporter n=1 Tax=Halobaculum halobium TaxID=3032281 RepID=A0ABD5TAU1_9EURY|nr:hypothetical protein [Halobaculum sp. SYNS20]